MKKAAKIFTLIMAGIITMQAAAPAAAEEFMDQMEENELVLMDEEEFSAEEYSLEEYDEADLACDDIWEDMDLIEDEEAASWTEEYDFAYVEIPEVTVVNPLYADIEIAEEEVQAETDSFEEDDEFMEECGMLAVSDLAASNDYCTSVAEATLQVREHFKNREKRFTLQYKAPAYSSTIAQEVMAHVFDHTGNPKEGDYLLWQYENWKSSGRSSMIGGECYMSLTFNVNYATTKEQEDAVDAALVNVLGSLNVYGADDYDKIKAVYDYICTNVHYNYGSDLTEAVQYSAYGALINHSCVCQGYALLTYRMMLELGIDCRMITGMGGGGAHAWNVVKLNNTYYNIDTTWDADTFGYYSYFLKNNAVFADHTRDARFEQDGFDAAYTVSAQNYEDNTSSQGTQDQPAAGNTTPSGSSVVPGSVIGFTAPGSGLSASAESDYQEGDAPGRNQTPGVSGITVQPTTQPTQTTQTTQPTTQKPAPIVVKPAGSTVSKVTVAAAPQTELSQSSVTLKKGKKVTIKVLNLKAGDGVKSWKVKNKKIATVSKKGVIKAKKKGKTVVTVTFMSGLVKTVSVKVK